MFEKYSHCPLCKSGRFHNVQIVKDFSVSQESFAINECEECKLLFTNPFPTKENIGNYYKSEHYISHTNKSNSLINFLYKQVRNLTLGKKIGLIKGLKAKSILDVGCGTGHFLEKAYKKNFKIKGIETDKTARENISTDIKQFILPSINDLPQNENYDVITMWHVLEHLHNLQGSFSHLNKVLKKKGYFIIAVPNPASIDAKHYKEYWAAWDVPRHLYHFKPEQIKYLFKQHNLLLIKQLPMKFDSFYVSMLSEKYKGKGFLNQIIFGMIYGFLSNFKASKNQYSSLIYIGQKK